MSMNEQRMHLDRALDDFQFQMFSAGWDSVLELLERLADFKHNEGEVVASDTLRWAAGYLSDKNSRHPAKNGHHATENVVNLADFARTNGNPDA